MHAHRLFPAQHTRAHTHLFVGQVRRVREAHLPQWLRRVEKDGGVAGNLRGAEVLGARVDRRGLVGRRHQLLHLGLRAAEYTPVSARPHGRTGPRAHLAQLQARIELIESLLVLQHLRSHPCANMSGALAARVHGMAWHARTHPRRQAVKDRVGRLAQKRDRVDKLQDRLFLLQVRKDRCPPPTARCISGTATAQPHVRLAHACPHQALGTASRSPSSDLAQPRSPTTTAAAPDHHL
jgi:hypothetical protein